MISLMPRRVDSAFCSLIFGRGTLDAEDFVVTSLCWSSIVLAACPVALGRLVCAHDGISLTCGGMRAPPPQPVNRIADFSEPVFTAKSTAEGTAALWYGTPSYFIDPDVAAAYCS